MYFSSNRLGAFHLWRAPASGGTAVRLAGNPAFYATPANTPDVFYLTRARRDGDVRRLDLASGEETVMVDAVANWSGFTAGVEGLLFLGPGKAALKAAGASDGFREVLELTGTPGFGLSVSPDGHSVLVSRVEEDNSEIMLAEEGADSR